MNALRLFTQAYHKRVAEQASYLLSPVFFCICLLCLGFSQVADANASSIHNDSECFPAVIDKQTANAVDLKQPDSRYDSSINETPYYRYHVIARYPHDPEAFTEGLLFHANHLFESTGLLGKSTLRKVDINTGVIIKHHAVTNYFFAEGLTILDGKLVQMTWKRGRAFLYNPDTLQVIGTFNFPEEAWGLTTIDKLLVISNGSSKLLFYDPTLEKIVNTINVHDQDIDVQGLNELEYVNGRLYANVWPTPCIAEIAPDSGAVLGWLNLSALSPAPTTDWRTVMNGIAYEPNKKHFFITGKHWPYLYEIEKLAANNEFQTKL